MEWEKVWEMRRDLRRFCGDPDGRSPTLKREALLVFESVMSDYSNLVTSMQINRIPATLASTGLVAYDTYDLRQQLSELEDTLSWRPLANDLGLRAYALDLFHLIELHPPSRRTPQGVKNKAQGFGAGEKTPNRKFSRADELQAIKESMHLGSQVAMVAETVQSSHGDYAKLRIVLPSAVERLVLEALRARNLAQAFDVLTYRGSAPTADLLMSEENCSVLLVLEDMASPQGAWTVPVMSLGALGATDLLGEDLDPDELAPVLVMSVLCHSVEMKVEPCIRRIIPVLEQLIMNGIREEAQLLNLFTDFFALSAPPQETQNAELLKEASEELMNKVGPLIRQAYASSFGEMRRKRVQDLTRARSAWLEENSQRRKREAKRKAALDELEKAANAYDTETFQRLAQEAKRSGVLEEAEGRDMEESLYAELEAMEAPFKRLVEKNSAPRPGAATVSLADEEVRKVLAGSKLPAGSGWRRAGEDLAEALQVLSELRKEAGSLEFRHHQSPAALRVAVLETSAKLKLGEAAVVRFEGAVRAAGVKLGREGAAPLRSVLKESRDSVEVGMRDQALWECLNGAPWSLPELRIDEFNSADLRKLEEICAKASGVALSHFAKPLEAALSRGKCAAQLLRATEAEDRAKLEELLAQASEKGLVALEDLEFALREMEANEEMLDKVRTNAKEVMAKMDVALFEEFVTTVAGGAGVKLPEEQELRTELFTSIRKEEMALREPLMEAVEDLQGLPSLRAAIKATSLPSSNRWRGGAEACAEALQVAASVRRATALASEANREEEEAEDPLQALPSAVAGITALGEALEGVPAALELLAEQGDRLEEEKLSAAPSLMRAHEEGQVVLRGLRADRALRGRLMEEPWCLRPLPLKEAIAGDMDELQKLAEGATMDGLRRATAALDAAFAAGRCARALDQAMQNGTDSRALELRIREAKSMGFSGLEAAESQLEELRRLTRLEAELEAQERQDEMEASQQEEQRLKREQEVADQVEAERRRDVRWNEVVGENSNLIFLDLELTSGFYEFDEVPRVLEAAIVVTDKNLNEIAQGSWVIGGFSHEELSSLSAFHQAHFRDAGTVGKFPPREGDLVGFGNGLFSDVLTSSLTKEQVEEEIITVLRQHCPPGACPLAGYSVQCDREVLRIEMPRLYRYVSHQIVDVSSFMRMARVTDPERVRLWDRRASRYNHRALNDARDAIEALRWVLDEFFRPRR